LQKHHCEPNLEDFFKSSNNFEIGLAPSDLKFNHNLIYIFIGDPPCSTVDMSNLHNLHNNLLMKTGDIQITFDMAGQSAGRGKFASLLILLQGLLLILFVVFVEYDSEALPDAEDPGKIDSKYPGLLSNLWRFKLSIYQANPATVCLYQH
jgi:hypothetical protein